jgi:hypothetical protein
MRHRITFVAAIAAVLTIVPATASSAAATLPFTAHPHGASYETWLQRVGQFYLGDASNPLIAGLDGHCGELIDGVFVLVAPIALDQEFDCEVPVGTPIVLSHAGWFATEGIDGDTDAELEAAAATFPVVRSELSVDGHEVRTVTFSTGAWDVISEEGSFYDTIYGLGTGPVRTALTGELVVLHPLSPGDHVIEAAVTFTDDLGDYSAVYHIQVTTP